MAERKSTNRVTHERRKRRPRMLLYLCASQAISVLSQKIAVHGFVTLNIPSSRPNIQKIKQRSSDLRSAPGGFRFPRMHGSRDDTATTYSDKRITFELPIFPLRKTPRIPTDTLTLNLYEERYLAMSEYILHKEASTLTADPMLFGALYTTNLPQIVPKGTGPIVPLLKEGNIGTLFVVDNSNWLDEIVPFDRNDPSLLRRRIKLNGVGIARFRIEKILSDGTTPCLISDTKYIWDLENDKLPFILVQASLLFDDRPDNDLTAIDELVQANDSSIAAQYEALVAKANQNMAPGNATDLRLSREPVPSLLQNLLVGFAGRGEEANSTSSLEKESEYLQLVPKFLKAYSVNYDSKLYQDELVSFLVLTQLVLRPQELLQEKTRPTIPVKEVLQLLSAFVTSDRIHWICSMYERR